MNLFTAIIYKEDFLYVAQCPEVGTASQGDTIEEAIKNLQEATELYLKEFSVEHNFPLDIIEDAGGDPDRALIPALQ